MGEEKWWEGSHSHWPLGPRHSIHIGDLVALTVDPEDLRFGEIAAVKGFRIEDGPIRIRLHFSDAHEHDALLPPISAGSMYLPNGVPSAELYYRHPEAQTPGGELLIARGHGLRELEENYLRLSKITRPGKEQAYWLSPDFLDLKYRLIFGVPLPNGHVNGFGR